MNTDRQTDRQRGVTKSETLTDVHGTNLFVSIRTDADERTDDVLTRIATVVGRHPTLVHVCTHSYTVSRKLQANNNFYSA